MNRRELILICLYEVILACLIFCAVGTIFHGCDDKSDAINAVEKDNGRTVVIPEVVECKGRVEEEYSGPGRRFLIPMLVCDDERVFRNVVNYWDSD